MCFGDDDDVNFFFFLSSRLMTSDSEELFVTPSPVGGDR
jgi:hypothetical protein